MKKNSISKKLIAFSLGALAIGAGIGIVGANQLMVPEVINNTIVETITETVEVPVEVVVEKNVTVEVPVEVEKIVEVVVTDNELVQATCDRLFFDDIRDCQLEVKAEDSALNTAWDFLAEQLADDDFLEDELKDSGLIEDEDEVSIIKMYKDFEDIEVVESDYDDSEYEFILRVKIKDEEAELKKYLLFTVRVDDEEAEFIEVEEE